MKNTVYILAKQHAVTPPELFAATVATHFVQKYDHIHAAQIKVIVHRWTRMTVDGEPHPHSFFRDGAETRTADSEAKQSGSLSIRSAIAGLLVLKSTGSQFHSFVRDEYTTLPDVYDRILSTEVDCGWEWMDFPNLEAVKNATAQFDDAWERSRKITMEVFAKSSSPSVQNTMYKMCDEILKVVPGVEAVDYSLPNKHYFEIGK